MKPSGSLAIGMRCPALPAILFLWAAFASYAEPPNILLAISDDQSFAHTSATGSRFVRTPAFDRVASEGVLFAQAFCAAPGCSPSRAGLLTGRNIWQNREAGTHGSNFPSDLKVFTRALESEAGYHVGYTGKAWGPGNFEVTGWDRNPVGDAYNALRNESPKGIGNIDYAANFDLFLEEKAEHQPFFFWFGASEPHRAFDGGSGLRAGKRLEAVSVPGFLPDHPAVRSDLLDYAAEIEWFDRHLARMLERLEAAGELENTLIVVTSDNGMAFPRAKANLYEYGIHVPMAMRWGERIRPGRRVEDPIGFIDLAPTFLEIAGIPSWEGITGRSLLPLMSAEASGRLDLDRDFVLAGRERHTHARPDNLGYPCRAIRTDRFLYIRNFKPELRPAGDEFHDIDDSPSKSLILDRREDPEMTRYFEAAAGRRAAEELYDIQADPACMHDLANAPEHLRDRRRLNRMLMRALRRQKDPRVTGNGDRFDAYPRYSRMRPRLGGFAERGAYNPAFKRE